MKLFRTSLTVGAYALLLLFAVLLPTRNSVKADEDNDAATVETNSTVDSTTSLKNTTDTSDTPDDITEGSDAGTEVSADDTVPPTDPPPDYYGEDVPFSDFVAHTSRTIPAGAGINGLYLTLGNSVDDADTDTGTDASDEDDAGSCVIGNEVITGNLHNIIHTIEPVFYNKETNSTPSITVSSYPENLIDTIVFGQDKVGGYHKFLRLEYNEEMVRKSIQNTNNTLYHYYGVLIQFPSNELEEVHVGGDLIVEMKEGFTNTSLVRATDRSKVDVSYDGENTMYVRSSQQSQLTLDVGHHDDLQEYVQSEKEKIRAIASGSSIMKISGTVERMECVQNATCVVDGPILSEDCTDSIVAMNATLETDDCSCVVVINPTAPITQLIKNGTTTDSDSTMMATTKQASSSSSVSFYNNENHTARCIDTTYIPSVMANTDGPSTTNQTFACPADVMTVPLFTPPAPATSTEEEEETSSTTTAGEEEVDMYNPTNNTSDSTNTTGTTNSTEKTNEEEEEDETASTEDEGQFIQIAWETDDSSASSRTLSVAAMTMLMMMMMTLSIVCLLVQELLEVVEEYTDKKQAQPEDAFSTVR